MPSTDVFQSYVAWQTKRDAEVKKAVAALVSNYRSGNRIK
jgi:hypothetical protein